MQLKIWNRTFMNLSQESLRNLKRKQGLVSFRAEEHNMMHTVLSHTTAMKLTACCLAQQLQGHGSCLDYSCTVSWDFWRHLLAVDTLSVLLGRSGVESTCVQMFIRPWNLYDYSTAFYYPSRIAYLVTTTLLIIVVPYRMHVPFQCYLEPARNVNIVVTRKKLTYTGAVWPRLSRHTGWSRRQSHQFRNSKRRGDQVDRSETEREDSVSALPNKEEVKTCRRVHGCFARGCALLERTQRRWPSDAFFWWWRYMCR